MSEPRPEARLAPVASWLYGGGQRTAPEPLRAIGRLTLTALVVNAILGSGIFGLPAVLAGLVGRAAPWAWLLGAFGNAVVMLCFAEVASRFSEAGGAYLYARTALPRLLAIQVGWLAFLTRLSAAAAGANLFTVNLAALWPPADHDTVRIALLVALVGGLAAVNLRGVAFGAVTSNVLTVGKLVPLTVLLCAFGWLGLAGALPRAPAALFGVDGSSGDWLRAILLVAFAFGGYDGALLAMGEARNPRRDAPFALLLAMLALTAIYAGLQLVVDRTLAAPASAARPLAAAAGVLLGPAGELLLVVGALVSIVGFLGANFLNAPRLTLALAEHRDLARPFAWIHPRWRTPYVSILAFAGLTLVLAIHGSFAWNAMLSAVARLFVYASTCAAVLVLRTRDPRGAWLTLPGGWLLPGLGIGFCVLLAARMTRAELVVVAVVATVATVHWALVRREHRPAATDGLG